MAVTKTKKKTTVKRKTTLDSSIFTGPRSYLALLYGALTVFILFFIIFLGIKFVAHRPSQTIGDQGISIINESKKGYIVLEGETLWSIAEKKYNDGFKWGEISKANNLSNPGVIEKGQKLVLPEIKTAVANTTSSLDSEIITGETYTVAEGDTLWSIAVRAYGDGYKWVEIASKNNLADPNVIHPGNKFILPRG